MASTQKAGHKARRFSREIVSQTAPTPQRLMARNGEPMEGIRVVLAPLCGITDAVFRKTCMDHGAELAVSEMISSEGLVRNSGHIQSLRHLDMSQGPLSLQIFGADPEVMGEAAAILSELKPRFVDINFGCPVRKIVKQNGGSAILKDLGLLGKICSRVVKRSGTPVSAKIRAGWDKPAVESVRDIARVIEDAGVAMITVHARTKVQGFDGSADWLLIKTVKETVSIPVVGNGDVTDGHSYLRMKETTGCDAVMIGRSAIGNPWIFGEINAAIDGREYTPPSLRDRVAGLVSHIRSSVRNDGEPFGVITTRRVMAAYLKHVPNARGIRARMMTSTRLAEVEEVLETFLARIDPRTSH